MRAFAIAVRGAAPEYQEVEAPQPGEGEVLATVEAASVNGFDISIIAGYMWDNMPHSFPVVLGRDFVGTVTKLGAGIDGFAVGTRIAGALPSVVLGPGTFGGVVVAPASGIAALPSGMATVDAAAVGLAGIAAYDSIERLEIASGDVVFISGATGGAGHLAVQLAARRGATVIATGQPGDEEKLMRSLGAAEVVDHTGDVNAQIALIAPNGVDKAMHAAGDPAVAASAVRSGGIVASLLGATADQAGREDVTIVGVFATTTPDKLSGLLHQVADGRLRANVSAIISLDEVPKALDNFRGGALGKVVLTR
jgi:NADPH:quinone reductase-like Zn-dependent oxidoreductase